MLVFEFRLLLSCAFVGCSLSFMYCKRLAVDRDLFRRIEE